MVHCQRDRRGFCRSGSEEEAYEQLFKSTSGSSDPAAAARSPSGGTDRHRGSIVARAT